MIRKIIFVYNADSGRLAAMLDSVKKAVGSAKACSLCTITHGLVSKKVEWGDVENQLGFPVEYYHRDDMPPAIRRFIQKAELDLPVVLLKNSDGTFTVAVPPDALQSCTGDPTCLQGKLAAALQTAG
jgi:hypothetical protein